MNGDRHAWRIWRCNLCHCYLAGFAIQYQHPAIRLTIPIHRIAGSPSQRPFQVEPEGRLGFERKTNRHTSAPHGCDRIVVAAMFKPRGAYATAFKLCRCRFLTVKRFFKYNFNTKGL